MGEVAAFVRHKELGPKGYSKIAIIGSAPTSVALAPYDDPAWSIWGVSPGVYGIARRTDVWFEIHRWEPPVIGQPANPNNKPWFSPEYIQFMKQHKGPVFMAGPTADVENPVPDVQNGWRFPFEDYIAKYGRHLFTSSVAWMLAHAVDTLAPRAAAGEKVAIGLWGIDMAATEEWAFQRPGCQHFMGLALSLGIEVILPPESDLAQPMTLYGIGEYNPRHQKLLANLQNMQNREAFLANQVGQANNELIATRGAIGNMKYILATWTDDLEPDCSIKSAVSLAGVIQGRPDPREAALIKFDEPKPVDIVKTGEQLAASLGLDQAAIGLTPLPKRGKKKPKPKAKRRRR